MRSSIKLKALLSILILVLVLAFLQLSCSSNEVISSQNPDESTPSTPPAETIPIEPKVTIVIYSDYQCSACARLHEDVEGKLLILYVNTGEARLEMRLLPGLGPESLRAAEATLCAADQGKFWEYRDAIIAAWRESGKVAYSEEELKKTASEIGLDTATFNACLDSGAKREEVQGNHQQAIANNVGQIPMVFINGEVVTGAKPLNVYVEIIERQLAEENIDNSVE